MNSFFFFQARARLLRTLEKIGKEREKTREAKGDFLDEMQLKGNLSDEEKVSVALDILLAGYETTSGLLALVVYFIAQSPACVLQQLKVINILFHTKSTHQISVFRTQLD